MGNVDTIHAEISDIHSGSNYAWFFDTQWKGLKGMNHHPTSQQLEINAHMKKYQNEVRAARKGKRLKIIVDGDCIDGDHHSSGDVCTTNEKEQADIHIQLMTQFKKAVDFQRGDELYYVKGTDTHTKEWENYCGYELGAIPTGDFYSHDTLSLNTNGRELLFFHHGAGAGDGANEGNPLRNYLKRYSDNCVKDRRPRADILASGHVHNPTYATHQWRDGMKFRTIHGLILPAWQSKTRFGNQVAPLAVNKIGGVIHEIKADGTICEPRFCIMGYE